MRDLPDPTSAQKPPPPLSLPRPGVDPVLADRALGQRCQLGREVAEPFGDEGRCVRKGPRSPSADRGTLVIPGKDLQPQEPSFGPEVALVVGQGFLDGPQQRLQRRAIYMVGEERGVERIRPVPAAGQRLGLALDAVERGSEGDRLAAPGGQSRLMSATSHVPVGVVRQVGNLGQGQLALLAVQFDTGREPGGKVVSHPAPGRTAGGPQLGGERLFGRRHEVSSGEFGSPQGVGVFARDLRALDQGLDIERPDPGREAGGEPRQRHSALLQLGERRLHLLVPRVGLDEAEEVSL